MAQKPYHRFVWDWQRRELVGQFDEMYEAEDSEEFDSWQQGDLTRISRPIAKLLLDRIAYTKALDLGCGKGALTGLLWKENAEITALDISKIAINKARATYGDKIHFEAADILTFLTETAATYDLVFTAELLSYVERWREVIALAAAHTTYFYCSLYLPPDPMGFVKSGDDLRAEVGKHFDIVHDFEIRSAHTTIVLAKTRAARA